MKPVYRGVVSFVVFVVLIVSLSATGSAGDEVFVVSASRNGDANYMLSLGDGAFSSQDILQLTNESGINNMPHSFGNGIGDFDNDGDFDYIMGIGLGGGDIYIFEKLDSGNKFGSAVSVASWDIGLFPSDMAVADFDEDGNLDFVMSYLYSTDSGLYLGDGSFKFTYSKLIDTAADTSVGADAADFNNDGHADFVIAPNSDEPFFINLGKGDGTFSTLISDWHDGNAAYGIAAADFDNDGKADLAVSSYQLLDIYKGNGDGTFEWLTSHDYDLNLSAIDNYDFDGDGNQDLVATNFGSDRAGVAVLLGNGNASFTYSDTYGGGSGALRNAVSSPPYESNKKPVAAVDPMNLEVTVGEEIVFDGSASYDDDGQIVSYAWDFDDGNIVAGGTTVLSSYKTGGDSDEVMPSHVYHKAGKYTVTLKVTDDKGATASVQAKVKVLPVAATIQFKPYTLYLNSKDKWILATIRLSADYDARKIDDPSVCVVLEDGSRTCASSEDGHGFLAKLRKRFYRTRRALTVRFDRQDLIRKIKIPSENNILMVQGDLLVNDAWIEFEGTGKIRILERKKKEDFFSRYWKQNMKHFSKKSGSRYR